MSQAAYLVIAILIIVALLAIFIVSFVLNRRIKISREDDKPNNEKCFGCNHLECRYHDQYSESQKEKQ